jgi:hypothetical protein
MKSDEFYDLDAILKDYLFETNLSVSEIAAELQEDPVYLAKHIKKIGLDWVRRNNRKLSRGHAALTQLMQNLLPNEEIVNEFHIGERLMLDIYCPTYQLAAEYHGRQHFFYSNHFHKDQADFKASQERDARKEELCREKGIALVVFRFTDKLEESAVFERMMEAIQTTPYVREDKPKNSFKGNHYYEKMKQRNREYRKQRYRDYKRNKG